MPIRFSFADISLLSKVYPILLDWIGVFSFVWWMVQPYFTGFNHTFSLMGVCCILVLLLCSCVLVLHVILLIHFWFSFPKCGGCIFQDLCLHEHLKAAFLGAWLWKYNTLTIEKGTIIVTISSVVLSDSCVSLEEQGQNVVVTNGKCNSVVLFFYENLLHHYISISPNFFCCDTFEKISNQGLDAFLCYNQFHVLSFWQIALQLLLLHFFSQLLFFKLVWLPSEVRKCLGFSSKR